MLSPLQQDDAFLADLDAFASAPPDPAQLRFWWLGQSGFLVRYLGRSLLLDPYLSDSLTEKYAASDKPHTRMARRVVHPGQLPPVDLVTSSHAHTDHLDAATLAPIFANSPAAPLALPAANVAIARDRLAPAPPALLPLDHGHTTSQAGFTLTAIAAAHDTVETDPAGRCLYLSFIIQCGPFTLFHSGDTRWHIDLWTHLRPFAPFDLMLLPINGHRPGRRVAGNMNAPQAAALARLCQARLVVPHHYHMFTFNTVEPDEFVDACQLLAQPALPLQLGQGHTLSAQAPTPPTHPTTQ
jgi:L-ascorbate metabolism protein UlaG (beta-lactamase superfamily)